MNTAVQKLERLLELGGTKRDVAFLAVSAAALVASIIWGTRLPVDPAWVAIVLCGLPIVLEALIGLVTRFDIKADVLVSMALIASVCIGEDFAAGEVAVIMQLGSLLEDLTVSRARAGIERLVDLTPRTARVVSGGIEKVIAAEDVQVGDAIRVLPGETVPADGVIVSGQTSIDQSVMTGEPLPVDKGPGDEVSSGTVNRFGAFEMRALKIGTDSSIQRMVRLVQSADAGKAKIVRLADRWATWIVVAALTAAALTWAVSGEIIRAVTILVVFCPCALVLATPTAIMAAIGNATKHGFLVREGDALERLAGVEKVAFDKTGTLTYGTPKVVAVSAAGDERPTEGTEDGGISLDAAGERVFALAAAVERYSEHPLGRAIVAAWEKRFGEDGALPEAEGFTMAPGRGVSGNVGGKEVMAGNRAMLADVGIEPPANALAEAGRLMGRGCTIIYLACEGTYAGLVALSDVQRTESSSMVAEIAGLGLSPVLLTGDHPSAAHAVAREVGIEDVHAECTPETKLDLIGSYQRAGQRVCMVGDGINDAPALKKADVGIAMGGVGSDIAVDAADIALVDDKVEELPHLLALSKRMMRTIRLNLTFSMALNFAAVALAITGLMGPVVGALVHNAGSVLVIVNSAFLLRWRFSPQGRIRRAHGGSGRGTER